MTTGLAQGAVAWREAQRRGRELHRRGDARARTSLEPKWIRNVVMLVDDVVMLVDGVNINIKAFICSRAARLSSAMRRLARGAAHECSRRLGAPLRHTLPTSIRKARR